MIAAFRSLTARRAVLDGEAARLLEARGPDARRIVTTRIADAYFAGDWDAFVRGNDLLAAMDARMSPAGMASRVRT